MGPQKQIKEQRSQIPDKYLFTVKLIIFLIYVLFRSLIFRIYAVLSLITTTLVTLNQTFKFPNLIDEDEMLRPQVQMPHRFKIQGVDCL